MKLSVAPMLAAAALSCASCSLFDESGKTTVAGQVVDSSTGQAVANAQVRLFVNQRSSSSASYSPAGDWRFTDGQGKFSFAFDADADLSYILRASFSRGDTDFQSAPQVTGGRKNKNIRVPVEAVAWVRLHLVDVPPRTDAVNVQVGGFQNSFTLHPPLDTVIYRLVEGAPNQVVVWLLAGSRIEPETEHRIPYSVGGLDTMRIDIRY